MSSKLKTLILPQLVEQRRQSADNQQNTMITSLEGVDGTSVFLVDNASLSDITSPATPTFSHRSGLGHLRCSSSTSSLELPLPLASPGYAPECPVTSTGTHLCLGSSGPKRQLADVQEEDPLEREEEENMGEEHVYYGEQDVEEYAGDVGLDYRNSYLYGCLCDTPCSHSQPHEHASSSWPVIQGFDHEQGSAADYNLPTDPRTPLSVRPSRTWSSNSAMMTDAPTSMPESSFSGLTLRFGSRIHALSRWRSNSARSQRNNFVNLIGAPASEPSLSRAPSSRRSSLSATRRAVGNSTAIDEQTRSPPPMSVASPALSFYGSSESVAHVHTATTRKTSQSSVASNGATCPTGPSTSMLTGLMIDNNENSEDDLGDDALRRSLERERGLATTPLLPPLFMANPPPPIVSPLPPSLQSSPLQSPGIESPTPGSDIAADGPFVPSDTVLPSPPLYKKASVSSLFHPQGHTPNPSMNVAMTPTAYTVAPATTAPPPTLEPQDEWSDRLGHANYTITPKPPVVPQHVSRDAVDASTVEDIKASLHQLRDDWTKAHVNYMKHLVRVGEHYGTTSTTYALTDAKWAETQREWKAAHDALREQVLAARKTAAMEGGDPADAKSTDDDDAVSLFPPRHDMSSMVPQLIDGEGKFPHRGDEDIVGPMDRATFMVVPQNGPAAHSGLVSRDSGRINEEKRKMARFWKTLAGRVHLTRK